MGTTTNAWNNVTITNSTTTLTSDLNISGTLNVNNVSFTSSTGNVNLIGSLTVAGTTGVYGTATLNFTGTGTWSHLSTGIVQNNININTSGTLTISGTLYYQIGTITYTTGTVISTGSTLILYSAQNLNTNTMVWNNITFASNGSYAMSISSDLYLAGNFIFGGNGTLSGAFNIYCYNFTINNSTSGAATVVATMSQNVYVYSTLTFGTSSNGTGSNGANFYVNGNLSLGNGGGNAGTSNIFLTGTGSITGTNTFNHPLTINSNGLITIPTQLAITSSNFVYLRGTVESSNATLICGTASASQTLTNIDKIVWRNVRVTGNSQLSMNQFFNGSPKVLTTVSASTSTNYSVVFTDNQEKFSKFIKLSGTTVTNTNQLNVITNKGNLGGNVGIRFSPNTKPNGFAKNNPSVPNQQTFGFGGILADPIFS